MTRYPSGSYPNFYCLNTSTNQIFQSTRKTCVNNHKTHVPFNSSRKKIPRIGLIPAHARFATRHGCRWICPSTFHENVLMDVFPLIMPTSTTSRMWWTWSPIHAYLSRRNMPFIRHWSLDIPSSYFEIISWRCYFHIWYKAGYTATLVMAMGSDEIGYLSNEAGVK